MTKYQIPITTPPYILLSSDYSQQEPKMTAFVSQDPNMLKAFKEGKDIYATIASLAFNVPYEECMEFNPITGANQPEGKERRGYAKVMVLGICYGMSTMTIGESLFGDTMSVEERTKRAEEIYNAVLNAFPNLRAFMAKAQEDAHNYGYVETILGRRRHIPDMQLKPYEFVPGKGYVNPDIDPLDPKTLKNKNEIPARIIAKLEAEFAKYQYRGQIYRRMRELAEYDHIRVIDNTKLITDASRKCVNCVDADTEILTLSGWKTYDTVSIGDDILSYNLDTNCITRDTVLDVLINRGSQEMIQFETPSFSAISTPNHRWVTQESGGKVKLKDTSVIYQHKWPDYPILRVAKNNFVDNPDYTDNQLKVLGWVMTDGTIDYARRHVLLYQGVNRDKNRDVYLDMIATLDAMGVPYTDNCRADGYHSIYIKESSFKDFVLTTFATRSLSFEFISGLSQRQAEIVMRAMLQCDGCGVDSHGNAVANKTVSLCCSSAEKRDAFQYLAFVAGYATNASTVVGSEYDCPSKHKQYDFMPNIPAGDGTYYTVTVLRIQRAHIYPKHKSTVERDLSWCVTTGNHTWIARRHGKVFITGNSIIQGSAAELTKIAILKVFNDKEWHEIGGRILLPVHDEFIAEAPIRNADKAGEILSRLMSEAGNFLPFKINCDVTTTLRWYGLAYPCIYDKPASIEDPASLTASEVTWVQYHLFEMEYPLPVHKKEGIKLEGDKALGVDGEWSDDMDKFILDYINRYHISKDDFIEHIEDKVVSNLQKIV